MRSRLKPFLSLDSAPLLFVVAFIVFLACPELFVLFQAFIYKFVLILVSNDNLGNLLQGAGMALLTILVPIAIAVLGSFIDKKSDKENWKGLVVLELNMVLDFILNIKGLLLWSMLIFIPTLFWEKSDDLFRSIELILWAIGMALLVKSIHHVYVYIKSSDFTFHYMYLSSINDPAELGRIWSSVWQHTGLNSTDEMKLLEIFNKKLGQLIHGND